MTTVPSDIAIAQAAKLRPIADVAAEVGLGPDEILMYGRTKAKIAPDAIARRHPKGRLVLVTGINPTPAGEGKSTVTIGVTRSAPECVSGSPSGSNCNATRSSWMCSEPCAQLIASSPSVHW